MHRLSGWIQKYQDRITIMPGSGVNSQNIQEIHAMCGAKEYHTAARKLSPGNISFYNPLDMREEPVFTSVDEQEIQSLLKSLENFHQ
jgi:copper homeostasis protein